MRHIFPSNLAGGGHFWTGGLKWRNAYLNHVEGGCQPEIEKIEPSVTPGRLFCCPWLFCFIVIIYYPLMEKQ